MTAESAANGIEVEKTVVAALPVAAGRGCVAMDVPSSHGVCGGGEDNCGKSWRVLVPFVQASVGWSFITVTLARKKVISYCGCTAHQLSTHG